MVNSSVRSARSWTLGRYKEKTKEKVRWKEKLQWKVDLVHHCERYKAFSSIHDYFAFYK